MANDSRPFTADSPRPELQVLVGRHGQGPGVGSLYCADMLSLYLFVRDSAEWNRVASEGDPSKVPGLLAMVDAMRDLYSHAIHAMPGPPLEVPGLDDCGATD